ncbi:hypothetical protein ACF3NG_08905 [Aerococcaceae bacterium WGS1372]
MGLAEGDLSELQNKKIRLKVAGLLLLSPAEYKKQFRGDKNFYEH